VCESYTDIPVHLYNATALTWSISSDYAAFCRRNNCRFN